MVTAEKLYEENVKNMKRGASARATLDCIDGDKPFQREEYLRRPNYARAILGTYSEKPSIQERIQTIGRNHLSIGRGLYALVDKTIELTGKILSPIYKEAVRPLASELWGTFKEVVREVWNSGKIAVSTAYKTRQENKKLMRNKFPDEKKRKKVSFTIDPKLYEIWVKYCVDNGIDFDNSLVLYGYESN